MTYRTDDQPYDVEPEAYEVEEEEPRRGVRSWILIVALLMGTGSGSALAWRAFGGGPVFSTSTSASIATDKPAEQGDMETLRQQIAGSLQSTEKLLAAQQAEIKRLSDQVSALAGKLDLLQRPVTTAQAAIPALQPVKPKKKPDAAKPVAAKPAEAKPAGQGGPISTGGAPLPPVRLAR